MHAIRARDRLHAGHDRSPARNPGPAIWCAADSLLLVAPSSKPLKPQYHGPRVHDATKKFVPFFFVPFFLSSPFFFI